MFFGQALLDTIINKTLTAIEDYEIKMKMPSVVRQYVKEHPLLGVGPAFTQPDMNDDKFVYDYEHEAEEPEQVAQDPYESELLQCNVILPKPRKIDS